MLDFIARLEFMKIQEMRSGNLHLTKKMQSERSIFETKNTVSGSWESTPHSEGSTLEVCELDEKYWSVVSFERREGGSLTYKEAAELMSALEARGISGLCIITDEAAARIRS